jgi:DNA polymerase III delta prime subunit
MNGSDSTGVENVRQNIIGFLKTPPFVSKFKIVFIDEMDYMSNNAQAILRDVMQSYCDTGRFVCTCNYLSKILGPLQSRFSSGLYEMKTLSKDYIFNFAEKVLKAEGVEYDKDSVDLIISACVPDVRKVINTLQKNTIDRKLKKVDINTIISNEKKITGFFIQIMEDCCTTRRDATVNNNIPQILQLLSDSLDYKSVYQTLFFHEKLPLWSKIKVNQYMNTMESCAVPSAHLMACVYDSLQAGMVYNSMITKK